MPMEFFAFICPLTGLPTKGLASTEPLHGSAQVLYSFKPIGRAVFEFGVAVDVTHLIHQGTFKPRPDLAGLCRERIEKGLEPLIISHKELFGEPRSDTPVEFEKKQLHLLRFLYEMGGREHKKRNIHTDTDFPLAYAKDAKELTEIIDSLLDEGWLVCANQNEDPNSWPGGIRPTYYDVLPTKKGREKVKEITGASTTAIPAPVVQAKNPASLVGLHVVIQQAAGALFANGHYRQALLDACIAVDNEVRKKSQLAGSGTRLMEVAFSPGNPVLKMGDSPDEQQGFMALFRGMMLAVRNPKAHSLNGTHDEQRALEWLSFASVLLRNLDEAILQA